MKNQNNTKHKYGEMPLGIAHARCATCGANITARVRHKLLFSPPTTSVADFAISLVVGTLAAYVGAAACSAGIISSYASTVSATGPGAADTIAPVAGAFSAVSAISWTYLLLKNYKARKRSVADSWVRHYVDMKDVYDDICDNEPTHNLAQDICEAHLKPGSQVTYEPYRTTHNLSRRR